MGSDHESCETAPRPPLPHSVLFPTLASSRSRTQARGCCHSLSPSPSRRVCRVKPVLRTRSTACRLRSVPGPGLTGKAPAVSPPAQSKQCPDWVRESVVTSQCADKTTTFERKALQTKNAGQDLEPPGRCGRGHGDSGGLIREGGASLCTRRVLVTLSRCDQRPGCFFRFECIRLSSFKGHKGFNFLKSLHTIVLLCSYWFLQKARS